MQETKSALDAEISGEYLEAIRIYSDLNAQSAVADADERWQHFYVSKCAVNFDCATPCYT
jgi:hypothetical protein